MSDTATTLDVSPYLRLRPRSEAEARADTAALEALGRAPALSDARMRRLIDRVASPSDALALIVGYAGASANFATNADDRESFQAIAAMAERGLAL